MVYGVCTQCEDLGELEVNDGDLHKILSFISHDQSIRTLLSGYI